MLKNSLQYLFNNKLLFIVFIIALFIRSYQLSILPHGFYVEEMTNTYVGRFILLHGRDLYGNFFPLLYFDKFNDYAPVIPLYFSGIGTFFFGVNEFGGRFPIALMGALTVFPLFYLSQLIFKNKTISLFSTFALALLPWHVVLSRTTAEGVIGFFFYVLGILFILQGIEKKSKKIITWSFICFFITYFLYPSLRILVPLTLFPLPLLLLKNKKLSFYILISFVIFSLLTVSIASTRWGKARFFQTSLFSNADIAKSVEIRNKNLSNGEGPGEVFLARIFHNKVTGYWREFLNQYLSYFSTRYLFYEAGGQFRYYNVPDQGLLLVSLLPFLLAAFIPSKRIERKYLFFFVYLLAITPIPAALTVDFPPHVHRSMFMILPLLVLISYGAYSVNEFKYKIFTPLLLIVIFMCFESIYFWHQYSRHSDSLQSSLRNDSDREITLYVKNNRTQYDHVLMPVFERLPLYYLFYTNNFEGSFAGRFRTELKTDTIDNITYIEDWCPSKIVKHPEKLGKVLIIENGLCSVPGTLSEITHFIRTDQTVAYRVFKTK